MRPLRVLVVAGGLAAVPGLVVAAAFLDWPRLEVLALVAMDACALAATSILVLAAAVATSGGTRWPWGAR